MEISFNKTVELDGSSNVEIPLRSSAILHIKNVDNNYFIRSILAYIHPCNNSHPTRVKISLQYLNEINNDKFDFTNGFRCSDMNKFDKMNKLSVNIFELSFCQDGDKWKHNLIPVEISKDKSARVVDLLINKNHYSLIKK